MTQPQRTKTSGLAITAFVLSLLIFIPILPIIGAILGIVAVAKIKPPQRGKGLAIAAIPVGLIFGLITTIQLAVAVPAYTKYLRRSRESEAKENLSKIFKDIKDYYQSNHVDSRHMEFTDVMPDGGKGAFPVQCDQSNAPAFTMRDGNNYIPATSAWDDTCWRQIRFAIEEPIYYDYHYRISGKGDPGSKVVAWAVADLDTDGIPAYWYVNASIQSDSTYAGGKMATKATAIDGPRDEDVY